MRARWTIHRGAECRRLKASSCVFSWGQRIKGVGSRGRATGVDARSGWWDELTTGLGGGYGQGGSAQGPEPWVQKVGFHEGRFKRSKVLGAVRVKVFWSRTFLVKALTRDSRWSWRW